jgi:Alkylmercury lyase
VTDKTAMLPDIERRLHQALLQGLLTTGDLRTQDELAEAADIDLAELPLHLAALAKADYLALDDSGQVVCLYPPSPVPTPHVVEFAGTRRYAMCAIDALGIAAMLGQQVTIDDTCAVCRKSIRLSVEPGAILHAEPKEAVVIARRDGDSPAVETCCPFTLFACCQTHGLEFSDRHSEVGVLTLNEALASGETIFGDLLGDVLPAHRRRAIGIPSRGQS